MHLRLICLLVVTLISTSLARAGEVAFKSPPTASRAGQGAVIRFELAGPGDVEVAVLGADGKVVRHLAAGVLGGVNAPPAPLGPGLAQELSWDGRDDFAKPAGPGPFTVRVRAGLGAKFGRFIGQDPYNFGEIDGIVVGDDGNLYVSGFAGPSNQCQRTVRVFDPSGRFVRTLLPFPADLGPGAMKEVARWDESADAWRPRNMSNLNPGFYASQQGYERFDLIAVTRKTGALFAGGKLFRLNLDGSVPEGGFAVAGKAPWPTDKVWPQSDEYTKALGYHQGPTHYALSPDGRYLYLAGPFPSKERADPKVPMGSVWRIDLTGEAAKMDPFVVVPATADGPWAKKGNYGRNATGPVHGITVDAKGNLYVCDRQAGRVAVFDVDGKLVGQIPVDNPDLVAVHPTTGAVYVIRRFTNGWNTHSMILDKFSGFGPDARRLFSFEKFHRNNRPQIAISVRDGRTLIWLAGVALDDAQLGSGEMPRQLLALEDKGETLAVVQTSYAPRPGSQADFARIVTDPLREEVYVSNGENLVYRYDGRTGAGGLLVGPDNQPFYAPDLAIGYDGLLYVRSGKGYSGPLERVTRDLKPAPLSATGSNKLYENIYGRYGIGYCEKGVGVGPDGKVYESWMYDFTKYFVSGWNGDGLPLKGKYLADRLKSSKPVWTEAKEPEERRIGSAIIGPIPAENGGLRVDLQGNIYLGLRVMPKGYQTPSAFAEDPAYAAFTGSVVKFTPAGGAVLAKNLSDSQSQAPDAPRMQTSKPEVAIEGAIAMYPGVAPFSGAGFGGNSSCCVCRVARFDLDRFGRLALPNVVSNSVTVVDNAGNVICEFGKYGNFDSQYVPADRGDGHPIVATPEVPLAWPTGAGFTEKAIYICDTYNRRVVRADLTWQAEASCDVK